MSKVRIKASKDYDSGYVDVSLFEDRIDITLKSGGYMSTACMTVGEAERLINVLRSAIDSANRAASRGGER